MKFAGLFYKTIKPCVFFICFCIACASMTFASFAIGSVDFDELPDYNIYESVPYEIDHFCDKCGTSAKGASTMGHYCNISGDNVLVIYNDVNYVDLRNAVKNTVHVSVKIGVDVAVYDGQELYLGVYPERNPSYGPFVNISQEIDCSRYYIATGGGVEFRDGKHSVLLTKDITVDNVKLENKQDLFQAKADLEANISSGDEAFSQADLNGMRENLSRVSAALASIDKVESVIKKISLLPDALVAENYNAVEDAADAFDALSSHEQSLIPSDYIDILESALSEIDDGDTDGDGDADSDGDGPVSDPDTGDYSIFQLVAILILCLSFSLKKTIKA